MPQRRGWRQPKQDHSVYVQQLFKDFLARNNGNTVIKPQNETRTKPIHANTFKLVEERKQPGIFDRAVYARFERNSSEGGFIRQEHRHKSKTGLMRWIDQQSNKHEPRAAPQKCNRTDDYLNLPNNFFSGIDQMKMPFGMADKTLGNVTNNFIPPATSTPFERLASFGVSGVLSDPDEFQTNQSNQVQTVCTPSTVWDTFLKGCEEYFATVTKEYDCQSVLRQERKEFETLLKTVGSSLAAHTRPLHQFEELVETLPTSQDKQEDCFELDKTENHSLVGEHNHFSLNIQSPPAPLASPKTIAEDLMQNSVAVAHNNKTRNVTFLIERCTPTLPQIDPSQHDLLLTASPPSPTLSASRRRCLYESSFLLDQIPTEDKLMEKLDALLEDEEFNIQEDVDIDDGFDFDPPMVNESIMNASFPSHFQSINIPADDTSFADTPLYLSQDLMITPTPNFREAMF